MNALFDSVPPNLQFYASLNLSGWKPVGAEVSGEGTASMETVPTPPSPQHLSKRRRLSRLLDKLAVQLRNNNHYPAPHWFMHPEPPAPDDAPLDLSIKIEAPKSPQPKPEKKLFNCDTCGQGFQGTDRLAKHVASRHRVGTPDSSRSYECDVCHRRFARSDMLTRHARLHTGVKPYSCGACGQVFSRSDHLATHQRTHTGEKPYRCPACPYAACRRDMITRHMRTHARRAQPA